MKHIFLFSSFLLPALILTAQPKERTTYSTWGNPRAFLYDFSVHQAPYAPLDNPVSLNQGEIWDDPNDYIVPVDFPFAFMGLELSFLSIGGFGAVVYGFSDDPESQTAAVLVPFDTDLIDRGIADTLSLSPISYQVEGQPGQRILKVEWSNAGSYDEWSEWGSTSMHISFQMWLYEGTDVIEYHYGPEMINDPAVFYFQGIGAFIGLSGFDLENIAFVDIHLLQGPASDPELTDLEFPVTGTPAEGTVYRFAPVASAMDQADPGIVTDVWPNPARERLYLRAAGPIEKVTIYTVGGQPVWSGTHFDASSGIPVDGLAPGMYFLQLESARARQHMRWVKE